MVTKTDPKKLLINLASQAINMVNDDKREPEEIAMLLHTLDVFKTRKYGEADQFVSIKQAAAFLGENNVLLHDTLFPLWNDLIRKRGLAGNFEELQVPKKFTIPYTKSDFLLTFTQGRWPHWNCVHTEDWFLMADPGFSLEQLFTILGTNPKKTPFFFKDDLWPAELSWSEQREPSIFLVHLNPQLGSSAPYEMGQQFQAPVFSAMICAQVSHWLYAKEFSHANSFLEQRSSPANDSSTSKWMIGQENYGSSFYNDKVMLASFWRDGSICMRHVESSTKYLYLVRKPRLH